MSLDFNSEKCSPPRRYRPWHDCPLQREALVFASMAVGLSTITADNVREWLVRLLVWEELFGDSLVGPGALGVIERWVGLKTNVEEKPRERWLRGLLAAAIHRAECRADDALGIPA